MAKKILQIGPYPPPNNGWSVRLKFITDALREGGQYCQVLNIGKTRRTKSDAYVGVKSGFDYILKLIYFSVRGYHFHVHTNAQAVKGPIMILCAMLISFLSFKRAALTFHGGISQLYFPRKNVGKMYPIIYLNFLIAKVIICNDEGIKSEISKYGPWISKQKIFPIQAFSIQYTKFNRVDMKTAIERVLGNKRYLVCCYAPLRKGFHLHTLLKGLHDLRSDIGFVMCGSWKVEDPEMFEISEKLKLMQKQNKILLLDNLDHDQFMTLLELSDVYLRTYVSDGVASSVLEAMSQNAIVLASENGQRPEGVITYKANDSNDLISKLHWVVDHMGELKEQALKPVIRDTVKDEVNLLVSTFH